MRTPAGRRAPGGRRGSGSPTRRGGSGPAAARRRAREPDRRSGPPPASRAGHRAATGPGTGSQTDRACGTARPGVAGSTSSANTLSAEDTTATAPSGWAHAPRPGNDVQRHLSRARPRPARSADRELRHLVREGGEPEHAGPALSRGLGREVAHDAGGLGETAGRGGQDGERSDTAAVGARGAQALRGEGDVVKGGASHAPPSPPTSTAPAGAAGPPASRQDSSGVPYSTSYTPGLPHGTPDGDERGSGRGGGTAPPGTTRRRSGR